MTLYNWIGQNMILFSLIIVGVFALFRYFILPWLKKKTYLPKDFDPFKNLEQYENVKQAEEKVK